MKPFDQCHLYTFVDTAYLAGRTPESVAQQLCDGGSDVIQLRAKTSTPAEIKRLGETILPITRRARVGLVINDYPDIARQIGAMSCHLGQEDFFDAGFVKATDVTGPAGSFSLGLSTHTQEQALRALRAEAAYIAIGPVYATATKPGRPAVTLDYVRWAAREVRTPWFAIGGITLSNLPAVLGAGARRICVVSAILQAPDIVRACQEFKERLASATLT